MHPGTAVAWVIVAIRRCFAISRNPCIPSRDIQLDLRHGHHHCVHQQPQPSHPPRQRRMNTVQHYPLIIFFSAEDAGFIAGAPDLPVCGAWGATEADAARGA